MSEFVLNASETRPARAAAPKGRLPTLRPILMIGACAAVLAGFGFAASSVVADLIVPPKSARGPAIDKGLASSWPDLKDGLPARTGTVVAAADSKKETPAPAAGPRIASLPGPMALPAGKSAEPRQPQPQPVANKAPPARPTERIPVPTDVAVLGNPPAAKIVAPSRAVATLSPRPAETVRARDEAGRPIEEAARTREDAPRAREAAIEKAVAAHPAPAPAKTKAVAAKPATPDAAKMAAAKPVTPKPAAAKQAVAHTAAAEPESDETEILGVKLPSLAPAGQKLKDGVSALGDAVRNAF